MNEINRLMQKTEEVPQLQQSYSRGRLEQMNERVDNIKAHYETKELELTLREKEFDNRERQLRSEISSLELELD